MTIRIEEPSDGVRLLTIDRPERRNAIDLATYRALTAAIDDADHDPEVRCCVLTGAGNVLTSGNDLADFQQPQRPGAERLVCSCARWSVPVSHSRPPSRDSRLASGRRCCSTLTSRSPGEVLNSGCRSSIWGSAQRADRATCFPRLQDSNVRASC